MKNLRFYNKEGYPYNFQYNEASSKWEGKLLFDPNSSDVYKTIGLYVFEHVEPIEFSEYFDFNKFELFNNSGITFRGETKQDVAIENIYRANSSPDFHSKWVCGKGFHQLFPAGTVVKFKDIVGSNLSLDFIPSAYYTVIAVKKDAFLVETATQNDLYTNTTFTSGVVSTHNVIKYPDYSGNLAAQLSSSLYEGKKITVANSQKNDGVKSLREYYAGSGLNVLKRGIFDYSLSGETGSYINVEIDVFTDRPILYDGDFTIDGNTITFSTPFKNSIQVGQNIIFEDAYGNHLLNGNQYDVTSIVTNKFIATKQVTFSVVEDMQVSSDKGYYAKFVGVDANLQVNDVIYFSDNSISLNRNQDFKILSIQYASGYTTLRLEQRVHAETNVTLGIYNKLKYYEYDTITVAGTPANQALNGIVYLATNKLNFKQEIISPSAGYSEYEETIKALIYNYGAEFNANGINAYCINGKLVLEGLYEYCYSPYFSPIVTVKSKSGDILSTLVPDFTYSTLGVARVHYLVTDDRLYNEKVTLSDTDRLARNYHEEVLFNLNADSRDYGFTLTINGVEYFINYQNIEGNTTSTQETIKDFVDKYGVALYNNGILVYANSTTDHKLYIETLYPNVKIFNFGVKVNEFSSYTILYKNQNSLLSSPIVIAGNEINNHHRLDLFKVGLSTGMVISLTGDTHNENQKEYNIVGLTDDTIQLSYQGVFFQDSNVLLTISSREYIRMPRESYDKNVSYRVSWVDIIDSTYDESIFLYDISGEQLKPPTDSAGNYISSLAYVGQKPLFDARMQNTIRLNSEPNKKLEHVSNPKYQQTVFSSLEFELPQKDSEDYFNYLPKPIEIFIGYNSPNEGVNMNVLKIEKVENLVFSGITGLNDNYFIFSEDGNIDIKSNGFVGFGNYGFEIGQLVKFTFKDTSTVNQDIFENYDTYEVVGVYKQRLVVDVAGLSSKFKAFTSNSNNRTFNFRIEVVPREIARFTVMGQTENEDERFSVNLKNLGISINAPEEKIFRQSDIDEYGIDYALLNSKRKEMLIMYPEIYNYIGSYKSLIGAINYFGYSDLEVFEYYKNVDINSPLYKKYFKVRIPDMFDLSVDGWQDYDFIKAKGNRNNYQKTSMFNLTYRITDEEGNNLNLYSLREVQIKLQNLKMWLRENILPLSSNITDVTGSAKVPARISVVHDCSNSVTKLLSTSSCDVVNFNYIATLNFNTSYLFTLNFYTTTGTIPESFEAVVKTFSKDANGKLIPVQYFKIFKTDLDSFNFNVDKLIDPFVYIETTTYNAFGVGIKNNKMFNFDEAKNYYLVNNNFRYKHYSKLVSSDGYYIIDDDGQLWVVL